MHSSELTLAISRFRTLLKAHPDASFIFDLDGGFLDCNEALTQLVGRSRDELLSMSFLPIVHSASVDITSDGFARARGGHPSQYLTRGVRADGSTFDVEVTNLPMRTDDDTVIAVIGIAREVGHVEALSAALERNSATLRIAGRIAKFGGWSVEVPSGDLYWSSEMFRLLSIDSPAGTPALEVAINLHPEPDATQVREALELCIADGTPMDMENVIIDGNGARRYVRIRGEAARDDSGTIVRVEGGFFDITTERESDMARNRAQRLESLGTLAGGIAHDLNNVLTPILMAAQLLSSTTTDDDSVALLDSIATAAQRGSDMIGQVLSFARGTDGTREVMNPLEVLEDLQGLAAESLPRHIELRVQAGDLDLITADSTQILQVLLNLVTNARDAMPDGGVITVDARSEAVTTDHPMQQALDADRCLVLSVSDTGTGIATENFSKIFEPFFTTKDIGQGTGLGLATSLSIVRSHGGEITIVSPPGGGTTASVFLPVTENREPAGLPTSPHEEPPPGRGELVLVVDDEESIRLIVQKTLKAHGYRTLEAANGREAIEVAESSLESISVLLTDMMMPVMDGPATAGYFLTHYPSVAVVAASGFAEKSNVARATHVGVQYFLPKPFTASTLLRTIRVAIDEKTLTS